MTNILLISYYFPPEGGPAVQRVSKFVKYLPLYNYNPIVLTSKHPFRVKDPDLWKELSLNLRVYSIIDWAAYLPGEITKRLKKIFMPDKQVFWVSLAQFQARRLIKKNNIKLIFTSSPPPSSHLIAYRISKTEKIPYIADLRDEWSGNPDFLSWNNPARQRLMEQQILSQAAYVTTICQGAKQRIAQLCLHDRVAVIYNGYDPSDFPAEPVKSQSNVKLTFAYGGRLSDKTSPLPFFTAMRELINENELNPEFIQILVWGTNSKSKWLQDNDPLNAIAEFYPYQPHTGYLRTIQSADVLLLFVTKIRGSDIITGKVFEYLYFNKPILVVMEKVCDLNTILADYANAYICYAHDVTGIKSTLIKLNILWQQNSLTTPVNHDYISRFDRKFLTQQLAQVFDKCLDANQ